MGEVIYISDYLKLKKKNESIGISVSDQYLVNLEFLNNISSFIVEEFNKYCQSLTDIWERVNEYLTKTKAKFQLCADGLFNTNPPRYKKHNWSNKYKYIYIKDKFREWMVCNIKYKFE